jgi:hypothetical protein
MKMVRLLLAGTLAMTRMTALAQPCVGDCNGDSQVTVSELIVGVNIALGSSRLDTCAGLDVDHSSSVEINEILRAVNNALCGCNTPCNGSGPSPTPTPTPVLASSTPTPPTVGQILFNEGWEQSAVQRYAPNTVLNGDTGAWYNGDSISDDPEYCGGTTANYAQVIVEQGSRRLQLHSARNDTYCDDNAFVGPVIVNPPGPRDLNIAVDDSVYFAFAETGTLAAPDPCDAVIVHVEFDHEVDIDYVLQRGSQWDSFSGSCGSIFVENPLLLPVDQTSFVRNLNVDAASEGIAPVRRVTGIEIEVASRGDATFDDITFFRAANAPPASPTPTRTPTPPTGPCGQVQQGTWCFLFPSTGEEGPLSQAGCFIQFDVAWTGTLSGSTWQASIGDTPAQTFTGTFVGNPATSFRGTIEIGGQEYDVTGNVGTCGG